MCGRMREEEKNRDEAGMGLCPCLESDLYSTSCREPL